MAGAQHRALPDETAASGVPLRGGVPDARVSTRRADLSIWGASPLSRGDIAIDVFASYGSYVAEIRGSTGLLGDGGHGLDVGFSMRTMGRLWELEMRGRFGYRVLNGLLSLGAEVDPFSGVGLEGEIAYGVRAYAIASLHSLVPDAATRSGEPAKRLGSVAFSVAFGVEAMSDGLSGLVRRWGNLGTTPTNFAACDDVPATMNTPARPNPCNITTAPLTATQQNQVVTTGAQGLVRPLFRVAIEVGLSRHVNIFAGLERVIADQNNIQSQRAYYEQFWNFIGNNGRNDLLTYVHVGLTYKF